MAAATLLEIDEDQFEEAFELLSTHLDAELPGKPLKIDMLMPFHAVSFVAADRHENRSSSGGNSDEGVYDAEHFCLWRVWSGSCPPLLMPPIPVACGRRGRGVST